jgi:hypothetical protein
MAYAGITAASFRGKPGSLSQKIAVESAAIKAETDSIDSALAAGLKVVKVVVTGGLQNIISFAWQNPESTKILVTKAVLRLTAGGGTAGATMDIGQCASATDTADTLIDGVNITAAGLFDNVGSKGNNGLPQVVLDENGGTNDFITGKIIGANAASLDGKVYIFYTKV